MIRMGAELPSTAPPEPPIVLMPRITMLPPAPTLPTPTLVMMPGVDPESSVWTLSGFRVSSCFSAETVATTLPIARRCTPPAVPVTTISSSPSACVSSWKSAAAL